MSSNVASSLDSINGRTMLSVSFAPCSIKGIYSQARLLIASADDSSYSLKVAYV